MSRNFCCRGALIAAVALGLASMIGTPAVRASSRDGRIVAIGAENEYSNVIGQIGGKFVTVTAVMSNPNTDPHTFEASSQVAEEVSSAQLVVQNGVGYDSFMNKIEAASPVTSRKVIDVQTLLRLSANTENPHLWYRPTTMPAVAEAVAADLSLLDPEHASYFKANVTVFDNSLKPWLRAIAMVKSGFPNALVATTEPVADYMLQAAGTNNVSPWTLQADIMNGVDPSPQDVSVQEQLFSRHKVKVLLYNQQVTDTLTEAFISDAKHAGIPIVGVYETMPTPGYSYQSWMLAETNALQRALARRISTVRL